MQQTLDHTIALLARTPAALNALLRDLPEAWTLSNEGENTWSAYDVIGHLNHGERTDWIPRAKIILARGTWSKRFTGKSASLIRRFSGCRLSAPNWPKSV